MFDLEQEALGVEHTAEWRRRKAEEYPEDTRNLEAAEQLEKLAAEVRSLQGSDLHHQLDRLASTTTDMFYLYEWQSEYLRLIGFSQACPTGREFLSDMIEKLEPASA